MHLCQLCPAVVGVVALPLTEPVAPSLKAMTANELAGETHLDQCSLPLVSCADPWHHAFRLDLHLHAVAEFEVVSLDVWPDEAGEDQGVDHLIPSWLEPRLELLDRRDVELDPVVEGHRVSCQEEP